jgi:hypothetical protein
MCLILGTLTAILRGRFLLVHLENPTDGEILEMFVNDFDSEEFVISCVGDDVANEFADAESGLVWPDGVGPGNALGEAHFPPSVWAEAEARWASWDDR